MHFRTFILRIEYVHVVCVNTVFAITFDMELLSLKPILISTKGLASSCMILTKTNTKIIPYILFYSKLSITSFLMYLISANCWCLLKRNIWHFFFQFWNFFRPYDLTLDYCNTDIHNCHHFHECTQHMLGVAAMRE